MRHIRLTQPEAAPPAGTTRLTIDGRREYFVPDADAMLDYFGSTGPVNPMQARVRHNGDFAYWFEVDARQKEK